MGNILVINATSFETRVALVEDGTIAEYYAERKREKGIVGNIYKARVSRVLPGMQAAFVDLGIDKAGFLYVNDVSYDPSFSDEVYDLAEGEWGIAPHLADEDVGEDIEAAYDGEPESLMSDDESFHPRQQSIPEQAGDEEVSAPKQEHHDIADAAGSGASESDDLNGEDPESVQSGDNPDEGDEEDVGDGDGDGNGEDAGDDETRADEEAQGSGDENDSGEEAGDVGGAEEGDDNSGESNENTGEDQGAEECDAGNGGGGLIEVKGEESQRESESPQEPSERSEACDDVEPKDENGPSEGEGGPEEREDRPSRPRRRAKKRSRTYGRAEQVEARKERARKAARHAEIQDLIKDRDEIVVQVAKAPIGSKGARVTTHVSLPGRHLVFMPTVDHVGISRRIVSDKERRRLRKIIEEIRPPGTGFIVRTVADGVDRDKLVADARFLLHLWADINKRKERISAPALLHPDLDLILRATRDLFGEEVERLIIDDEKEYRRVLEFMEVHMPSLKDKVEHYKGNEPIFDAYGIEDEIRRAQQRKVWLKSGGYLIVDQAEALAAIDVNSGRYIGKKSLEETITKINIEAAEEVVYQLRLRNMGGIIILDFIDMESAANREKVYRALEEALRKDKAKTNILKISEFGLVEMTRKRVRESLTRMMNEPCPYCDGRGLVKTVTTVAYEVLRDVMREAVHRKEGTLFVNCNPEVSALLTTVERDALRYTMEQTGKKLVMKAQEGYHREQYDLYAKSDETGASVMLSGGVAGGEEEKAAEAAGGRASAGQAKSSAEQGSKSGGRSAPAGSSRRRRRRRGRGRRDSGREAGGNGRSKSDGEDSGTSRTSEAERSEAGERD